jgi:hypothetical protein
MKFFSSLFLTVAVVIFIFAAYSILKHLTATPVKVEQSYLSRKLSNTKVGSRGHNYLYDAEITCEVFEPVGMETTFGKQFKYIDSKSIQELFGKDTAFPTTMMSYHIPSAEPILWLRIRSKSAEDTGSKYIGLYCDGGDPTKSYVVFIHK